MKMNYARCGVMHLLLKEVKQLRKGRNSLWQVNIGGKKIGYIETGHSTRKRYKYEALTVTDYEIDAVPTFMKALSLFIDRAITELTRQGDEETNKGKIGVIKRDEQYFIIGESFSTGYNDTIMWWRLWFEDGKQQRITPFELRYQTLMGWIELE